MFVIIISLLVAFPNAVEFGLWQFLGHKADDEDNGEAADHGDGTTVDGVDGVAHEHVDHCEADTPDEACPYGSGGDAAPVETQEEWCEEGTSQSAPTDTHELGDECWRIEGDEHGNGDEEDDEHTHDDDLATLNLLCHFVINRTTLHLVGCSTLVAIDEVEGHGG